MFLCFQYRPGNSYPEHKTCIVYHQAQKVRNESTKTTMRARAKGLLTSGKMKGERVSNRVSVTRIEIQEGNEDDAYHQEG